MRPLPLLALLALPAAGDEWEVAQPKPNPRGSPHELKLALDPARAHHATVKLRQVASGGGEEREFLAEIETHVRITGPSKAGGTAIGAPLGLRRMLVGGEDMTAKAQAAATGAYMEGAVEGTSHVKSCEPRGAEALGPFAETFRALPAWILPYLPPKPVKVGDVWEVPAAYVLWNIRQAGDVAPEGKAWQTLDSVQTADGVKRARLTTVFGLTRRQASTPEQLGLGPGAAVVRFKGRMTDVFGLDGYLRESRVEARMRLEHASGKTIEWRMERTVEARPGDVPAAPLGKDWSRHMGDLPFVVGYEEGMAEARFTGRPPMFVFTHIRSAAGIELGNNFRDKDVLEAVKAYTPVLIDADADKEFPKKFDVFVEPSIFWVGLDGELIFTAGGAPPLDIFVVVLEAPAARAPEPAPSKEYLELEKARDGLRDALARDDREAAVGAVLAIRKTGRGAAIQREAAAADAKLTGYGRAKLEEAAALLAKKQPKKAEPILDALLAEFEGHPVGERAAEMRASAR